MKLDELKPAQKTKKRTVVGRGVGSGLGKTSGRGFRYPADGYLLSG